MFKNYIAEVAKMLGVRIGEKFFIIDSNGDEVSDNPYKFTKTKFLNALEKEEPSRLSWLLRGDYTIEKIPWKPKEGGKYWAVTFNECVGWNAFSSFNESDLALLAMGNCFQTKEDAEAGKVEVLAKFEEIRKGVLE